MSDATIQTVGILGGGQLGAYLCQAARKLGLRTRVLATSNPASVDDDADFVHVGRLDDEADTLRVARGSDVVTYEIESIGPACLTALADARLVVRPAPSILAVLQDKVVQRRYYAEHGFPSPAWLSREVVTRADFDAIAAALGVPFVQKAATGGYDGKGVQVVSTAADLRTDFSASLFEQMVDIKTELGLLVARSNNGQMVSYPPVEMRFWGDNLLDLAVCPSIIDAAVAAKAVALGEAIVRSFQGVGLFCIEVFVDRQDDIIINELAARVHNSGHLTLEAFDVSQFEQHLRAVCGLPLREPVLKQPAAMKNLLSRMLPGTPHSFGRQAELSSDDCHVHWYMKPEARPLRKMGHVTATGATLAAAAATVEARTAALGFQLEGEQ
ncbi:MAG: ATP-grasp domain-containing protein [Pseudomonadota bacterium]